MNPSRRILDPPHYGGGSLVCPPTSFLLFSYDFFSLFLFVGLHRVLQRSRAVIQKKGAAVESSKNNSGPEMGKKKIAAEEEGKKKDVAEASSKHNNDGLHVLPKTEIAAKDNKKRISTCMGDESNKNSKRKSISTEKDFLKIIKKEDMTSTLKIGNLNNRLFDCSICTQTKQPTESFTVKPCSHRFCISCVGRHVAAKVEEKVPCIRCPDPGCKDGILGLEMCKWIVPETVLDRWGVLLCEYALGTKRFYCPFKDCSVLLVHEEDSDQNGAAMITNSECPHCHRMFCAQCKVPWHSDISCEAFQQLKVK